jgi:predicted dehydrogenase
VSATEPHRIAVVGAGVFGRNHLRVVRESDRATLTGVFDADAAKAQAAAQEFGCPALESVEEVAEKSSAVIVAVNTIAHAEVVGKLLELGLDVLVEKPIATRIADAEAMIEAACSRGRILQCGHLERFNPAVQAAMSIATTPVFFEIHRLSLFTPRSLDVSVVSDLMIHDLDIVLSMTGRMPEEVRAAGISILSEKVDIANVRLGFANGCVANLTASRVSTEKVRKMRFFQPGQYVTVDYARQDCAAIGVDAERQVSFQQVPVEKGEPLKLQFANFLDCLETRATPLVDGVAAARALRVARDILDKIELHAALVARNLPA